MINLPYEEITGNLEPVVNLESDDLKYFQGKKIIVTGAGGTIGSRIYEHLMSVPNVKLIAVDHDENALHALSLASTSTALFQDSSMRLLDIRDVFGIDRLFNDFQPDQIFHCAALKHLAILENYPREAYQTNVVGTNNLVNAANKFKVSGFLNISTDKAVSPTSVLGLTKRVSELIVSKSREFNHSNYTSVRFGNVFNSKGSVIETFTHQILQGKKITLTDPLMMRYFMHIDEAACLAIKAAAINAGDVHILDMGKPVYLVDVIKHLQTHFGTNLEVVVTGARKGEKLDEDLMHEFEIAKETAHRKIRAYSSNSRYENPIPENYNISDKEIIDLLKLIITRSGQ
jgi:FlaA1/EpsC-like NDP-sugar epimerase